MINETEFELHKGLKIDRYIVLSKDKTKILTYKGFRDIGSLNTASPKLFPSVGTARQAMLETYPENVNRVIYIKVDVSYTFSGD